MTDTRNLTVDYDKLKAHVTLYDVLVHFGFDLHAPPFKANGKGSFNGICPFHQSDKPGTRSFVVTPKINAFKCFSKGCDVGGNQIRFFQLKTGIGGLKEAAIQMAKVFNVPGVVSETTGTKKAKKSKRKKLASTRNEPLGFEFKVDTLTLDHPWFDEHDIKKHTCSYFGLAFYTGKGTVVKDRIAIPLRDKDGVLLGYAGWATREDQEPLVKYPIEYGFNKALELYHLEGALKSHADKWYIVPGFMEVWKSYQKGNHNVVGLHGHAISKEQLALLAFSEQRYVMFHKGVYENARRHVTDFISCFDHLPKKYACFVPNSWAEA